MTPSVTPVATGAVLGESPLWDGHRRVVMWVDIKSNSVHEYDPVSATTSRSHTFDVPVTALCALGESQYLVAAGLGFAVCDWPGSDLTWIALVDQGERMNDGACDPAGRILAGTMVAAETGGAALYQLCEGRVRLLLDGVSISNGLDWSPDGDILYYVDTPLERVDAFDYDVTTGSIGHRRTFVDLRDVPGRPDGIAVDSEGAIWVAMARGGGCIRRYTSRGQAADVVDLPVPHVTNLAFGGDKLDELFVTTSRLGLADHEVPLAGALFHVSSMGVAGRHPYRYRP